MRALGLETVDEWQAEYDWMDYGDLTACNSERPPQRKSGGRSAWRA